MCHLPKFLIMLRSRSMTTLPNITISKSFFLSLSLGFLLRVVLDGKFNSSSWVSWLLWERWGRSGLLRLIFGLESSSSLFSYRSLRKISVCFLRSSWFFCILVIGSFSTRFFSIACLASFCFSRSSRSFIFCFSIMILR